MTCLPENAAMRRLAQKFEADLAGELEAVARLRPGIEYMRSVGDVTSALIFEHILGEAGMLRQAEYQCE